MDKRDVGAPNLAAPTPEELQERLALTISHLDLYHLLDLVELAEAMARGEQTEIEIRVKKEGEGE